MSWGFEKGRVYNRRQDIHERFGGEGSRQSGIITFASHPLVIAVSGETGSTHGYADRWRPDGAFEYFGAGQIGDMEMKRGNAAIANHSADGKSLLLFIDLGKGKGLRFHGEMVCEAYHIERAPDRNGDERNAIVFELRDLDSVVEEVENTTPVAASLNVLRARALADAKLVTTVQGAIVRNVYERSRGVRDYVLARAAGHCEGCGTPAPFKRKDGSPYLEPHHLHRVSDGGPDHPAHVISLCPNCHRRVHAGHDGAAYNNDLIRKMAEIDVA
ncbi:HNH endonuclease [Pelagibacterium sediminicola]|uniref:HNH endonuclease n=1 Tax=Pelagibacterium sediminicola TaxID=2248761 RepID=UPI000E30C82A|nr:HNH endonuclease [Pelagibacterium sediminicola]